MVKPEKTRWCFKWFYHGIHYHFFHHNLGWYFWNFFPSNFSKNCFTTIWDDIFATFFQAPESLPFITTIWDDMFGTFFQAPSANLTTCLIKAPRMYHWLCAGCLAKIEAINHSRNQLHSYLHPPKINIELEHGPWKRSGVTLVCDLKDVRKMFVSHTVLVGETPERCVATNRHSLGFHQLKRPSTWSLPTGAADFWGTMLAACLLPKQFNLALQKWQGEGLYPKSHAAKQANWVKKNFWRDFRLGRKIEFTLPETNSEFAPENWMVGRRSFPFGMAYFQGRTVSFMEGKTFITWSEMAESQIIAMFYLKGSHSWTSKYLPPERAFRPKQKHT